MKPKIHKTMAGSSGKSNRNREKQEDLVNPAGKQNKLDTRNIVDILERISDGFVAFDAELNYTYVNRRGGEFLGRKPEDLIGRNYWQEYPEAAGTPFANAYVRALETQTVIELEDYYEPWGRWFENRIHPSEYGLSIFFSDITKRKQSEDKIRYLTRLYATLSQIHQAIVMTKARQEFFEAVCRVAVKYGQFHLSWIGLTEPETGDVRIVASSGEGQKYIQQIPINYQNEDSREGPTSSAIRLNKVVVVNDVKTDVRMAPWRDQVIQPGYSSLAAVPLCVEGEVIGVLDLYATEVDFFTQDELSLLEEIGADLSFALDVLLVEEERRRAHHRIETQLQRLSALRAIDTAITAGLDLRLFFDTFVQHLVAQPGVDAAAIWTFHQGFNELELATGRGFQNLLPRSRISLRDHLASKAIFERTLIHIPHLNEVLQNLPEAKRKSEEGFISYIAVPLIAKGQVKGVMELFQRVPFEPDPEWLDFIQNMGDRSAIAIADAQTYNHLQRTNLELLFAYDETIEGWSRVLDLRDKETVGHTQRVTKLVTQLASLMEIRDADLVHVRRGALLHDIGKMGVPDAILLKPSRLTPEEWIIMRMHPQFAYDMLTPIRYLQPALDIPFCHHEKWDGTGYPRGLKETRIPLAARIFAIVDVWDALTSDRPYRTAWSKEKAMEYIRSQAGSHFDPQVVDKFFKIVHGDGLSSD
jgi:PAS domain S-box-containing protein